MATLAEKIADLANVEAAIQARYSTVDTTSAAPGGGSVSIKHGEQLKFLLERRKQLRLEISLETPGGLDAAPNLRGGIDTDRGT